MTSESNNNNNLQHMDNAAAADDDEGVKVSTATNHKEPSAVDGLSRTSKTEEVMSAGSSHNNRDGGGHENQNNNKNNKNNDDILPTSATEKVDDTLMIGDYSVDYLVERALKKIDKRTSDWEVLNHTMDVPALSISEIEIGRFLGEGGFFKVHEIQKITLENDGDDESETQAHEMEELKAMTTTSQTRSEDVESSATAVAQNRRYMEKHYCRVGKNGQMDCRFAIKTMKKGALSDPGLFVNTLVDMAIEAKFLCSMRHPNIIKMRGISTNFIHAGSDSFIILDRLYQTLSEKMDSWKHKKENSFSFAFDFRGKKTKAFLAERLTVGFDIANALEYLHDRNIIYRDLKPDNLGFDVRGDIKLFDFGLATEFDKEKHGGYKLTGDTGTIRYMAPEVAMEQCYSEKADVYSFGVLLWQILSLEIPYGKLHGGKIEYSVCHLGLRPKIEPSWPPSMKKLLEDCFARNAPLRPSMEVICDVLQREANSLADKKLRDQEWMDKSKTAQSERYFE